MQGHSVIVQTYSCGKETATQVFTTSMRSGGFVELWRRGRLSDHSVVFWLSDRHGITTDVIGRAMFDVTVGAEEFAKLVECVE